MKRFLVVMTAVAALAGLLVAPVFGADKLLVKDSSGTNTVFVVQDTGVVGFGNAAPTEFVDVQGDNVSTNFKLTKFGGNPGAVFRAAQGTAGAPSQVLANGVLGGFVAAGYTSGGAFSPNKVGIYFAASENFTPAAQGTNLFIQTTATGTTTKATKAIFNDGGMDLWGVVTTHSSRASKDDIEALSADKAIYAVRHLEPVTFSYKFDKQQPHVGFIAEDVPELVATKDRRGVSSLDIVAVLTKVVKEQDKAIEALSAALAKLESKLNKIESMNMSAQK